MMSVGTHVVIEIALRMVDVEMEITTEVVVVLAHVLEALTGIIVLVEIVASGNMSLRMIVDHEMRLVGQARALSARVPLH